MWAVDGEKAAGEWDWQQQPDEEKPEGSINSVEKTKETINIDEDGYETVRRPRQRTLGQYMPEIFAVEFEKQGESKKTGKVKIGDVQKIGDVKKKTKDKDGDVRGVCEEKTSRRCEERVRGVSEGEVPKGDLRKVPKMDLGKVPKMDL